MKEIRAARPRDAKAALAPAETRAATPLWIVPRQPSDFGRRRVSGAETWNSTRLVPDPPDVPVRSRAQSVFSDVDLERVRRMVRRGRLAVVRPEFEEGNGRSGLLVSSAGAVAAGNWIPMLKGGL